MNVTVIKFNYDHDQVDPTIVFVLQADASAERTACLERLRSEALTASVADVAAAIDDLGVSR